MVSASEQPASSPPTRWQRTCRWLWRGLTILWGGIIAVIAFSTIANIFTTPISTPLPQLYVIHWIIIYRIPLFFVVGGLLLLTVVSWRGSREHKVSLFLSPDQQSRTIILKSLRKAYTGELAASLQGAAHIALGLHESFDLTHPSRLSSWGSGQPEQVLPDEATIIDAFDQAGNGLLILGEPGAGKTTLLYDLALALLSRAEQNEQHPLPVILNLSSWATKRLPLQEWIIEELSLRYLIPRQLSQRWEQQLNLLLLLDGLDEVAASARDACTRAINAYHSERLVPLVVCSRREEYQAMPEQFTLQSAVIVQPLTHEQVKTYLVWEGKTMTAVRKGVQTNVVLLDLLTTPLMLSMVMLAYKDKAMKNLPRLGLPEQQQQQIFERYIERVLDRRTTREYFTPQKTRLWLTWLAQQMHQHHVTEFYLEQLQPTWLPTRRARMIYELSIVYIFLPIFILVFLLFLGKFSGLNFEQPFVLLVFLLWLLMFLLLGLGILLITGRQSVRSDTRSPEVHPVEILTWSWKRFRLSLGYNIASISVIGLVGLMSGVLFSKLISVLSGVLVSLLPWLLMIGFFMWIIWRARIRRLRIRQTVQHKTAHPVETLTWSWKLFRVNLLAAFFIGIVFGSVTDGLYEQLGVSTIVGLLLLLFILFLIPLMLLKGLLLKVN